MTAETTAAEDATTAEGKSPSAPNFEAGYLKLADVLGMMEQTARTLTWAGTDRDILALMARTGHGHELGEMCRLLRECAELVSSHTAHVIFDAHESASR